MSPRPWLVASATALALASCAPPAQEAAKPSPEVAKTPAAVEKTVAPPPKKPVLLNGRGEVSSISLTDCFSRQQNGEILLYDARPHFFYALGRIPGAISLPKDSAETGIPKHEAEIKAALAEGKTIVIYCTNLLCPDARAVARRLASHGYSSSTLTGGWESWKDAGLPTE
ncbi:MAG: rhodanese-like domain-containing protein [Verrucomicrobiota bacterium]